MQNLIQMQTELAKAKADIEALRRENELLNKVLADLPGNIYWKDKNHQYLGCNNNEARVLGLTSRDQVVGKTNHDIFMDPPLLECLEQVDSAIYEAGKSISIEEYYLDPERGMVYFLSKKSPILDDEGEIIGLVGVSLDITQRKQMEKALMVAKEQAENASRGKSEFITNMSHDAKTPLVGMIGLAEMLQDRLQGEDQSLVRKLLASSNQLSRFFENCLQVFKLESENAYLKEESFSIQEVIMGVKELFEPAVLAKHLTLSVNVDKACPLHVRGYREEFFRVMTNLVSNAVKFTAVGSILVEVKVVAPLSDTPPDQVLAEIRIADTGIGIPKNKQSIVFEQFSRLTPSYKGVYDGHGIGLYIVSKFVQAMGGQLTLESEEHKGSIFTITLPFKEIKETDLPATQEDVSHEAASFVPMLRILLVEDHPIAQLTQGTLLLSLGHQITLASNGEEAVSLFSAEDFDLIFMDMGLPDIQGAEAAQQIRMIEQSKGVERPVPIIALTAHISDKLDCSMQRMGINMMCSKPLSRETAHKLIQQVMKPD